MDNIFSHVIQILFSLLGIVIIGSAVGLAATAKKAKYSEAARVTFVVFMAITLASIGAGAIAFAAFGKTILKAFGLA